MPRHQNSVVRSIIEQVFCFNLRKTHQDFDFFSSSKSLYVSLIFPYFIRALPARNKGKRPPWLLDTYSPNYRELDKSRRNIELDNFRLNENYYSRRNRELDKSRRDENYYSLRNRTHSNMDLRDASASKKITFFGKLVILYWAKVPTFGLNASQIH